MLTLGTKSGYNLKLDEDGSELYINRIRSLYDVRRDIINLNSELLFQGYYGFREIIVKEINKGALDVTEERKGSLKYNCITLLYQNLNVCIDRFNELHR